MLADQIRRPTTVEITFGQQAHHHTDQGAMTSDQHTIPSLSGSTGNLESMTNTQNTAGPAAPAPRAIISGYMVHSPPGLAGVVDQMCLDVF